MIDLTKLSSHYIVRELGEADVDKVLEICQGNPQFYEYTEAEPTREQILADMKLTPPGISQSAKYYLGFLTAVSWLLSWIWSTAIRSLILPISASL